MQEKYAKQSEVAVEGIVPEQMKSKRRTLFESIPCVDAGYHFLEASMAVFYCYRSSSGLCNSRDCSWNLCL